MFFSLFFSEWVQTLRVQSLCVGRDLRTNSLVPPIRNAGQDSLQPITLKKSSPSLSLPPFLSGCPRLVLVPSHTQSLSPSLFLFLAVPTSSSPHPRPVPLSHRVPFPWRPQPKGEGIGKDFEGEKRWERLIWEARRGGGGEVGRPWAKDFVMEGWGSRTYEACCRPVEGKMGSDTVENIKFGEVIGWERRVRTPRWIILEAGTSAWDFFNVFSWIFVSYLFSLFYFALLIFCWSGYSFTKSKINLCSCKLTSLYYLYFLSGKDERTVFLLVWSS